MGKSKGGFYAVARGRTPGIYYSWDDCNAQVSGFSNSRFKKFDSSQEAHQFIAEHKYVPQLNAGIIVSRACPTPEKQKGQIPTSALPRTSHAVCQSGTQPSRNFSTAPVLKKRKIQVTEERVTNKKQKTSGQSNRNVYLNDFTVEDGYVVVYTGGACTESHRQSAAKAGFGIWFGNDHALNMSEPVRGRQTTITAEILAAQQAIVKAKLHGIDKLNVNTDSQYVIDFVTMWIHKWKNNGWKLASGRPVVNQNDLEKLDCAMTNMDLIWSYVPGHQGHQGTYGKKCARRLARAGALKH